MSSLVHSHILEAIPMDVVVYRDTHHVLLHGPRTIVPIVERVPIQVDRFGSQPVKRRYGRLHRVSSELDCREEDFCLRLLRATIGFRGPVWVHNTKLPAGEGFSSWHFRFKDFADN